MNTEMTVPDVVEREAEETAAVEPTRPRSRRRKEIAVAIVVLLVVIGIAGFLRSRSDDSASSQTRNLPSNMFEVGLQLHQSGQFDQALMAYRSVLDGDPGNPVVHYNIGQIHQVRGQLDQALAEYDIAIAADPTFEVALYNRALTFRDLGESEQAIAGFESVLTRNPNSVGALYNLGNLLIADGRVTQGTELINRAIELDPSLLQQK